MTNRIPLVNVSGTLSELPTGDVLAATNTATNALKSASTTVDVSASAAPAAGQVPTATDSAHATWQYPGSYRAQVKSGRYLVPFRTSIITSLTPGNTTAYLCPVYVERAYTFSGIAFGVTTSNTNTSFSAHVCMYTDVNGVPTTQVSGTESSAAFTPTTTTNTNMYVPFSGNVAVTPGWYWLCMQPSSITNVSLVAISATNTSTVLGATDMITEGPRIGFSQVYGTLPSTCGTAVYSEGSSMIYLGLKVV